MDEYFCFGLYHLARPVGSLDRTNVTDEYHPTQIILSDTIRAPLIKSAGLSHLIWRLFT